MKTCYICDKPATTKEHVPPACLFPEPKDIKGKAYRRDLITVGSCDEHNSEKSDDDAYFMAVIVWVIGNNKVAHHHIDTKIKRAIEKSRKAFDFLATLRQVNVNGILLDGFTFDAERVETELEHIARGLYFKEFKQKYTNPLLVITPFLFPAETENSYGRNIQRLDFREGARGYMENLPRNGANQEIFYYQIDKSEGANRLLLRMVFYEGFEVYVGTAPQNEK